MECKYSRAKTLGMVVLGALMVSASYFCTTLPKTNAKIWGWIGVIFFGLCFVKIFANLFKTGTAFVINDKGVEDFQFNWGFIPWSDIVYVRIGQVKSSRFLCIEVNNPDIYLSRVPAWQRALKNANQSLGFSMININFNMLTPGLNEVWDYIQSRHLDKIKV